MAAPPVSFSTASSPRIHSHLWLMVGVLLGSWSIIWLAWREWYFSVCPFLWLQFPGSWVESREYSGWGNHRNRLTAHPWGVVLLSVTEAQQYLSASEMSYKCQNPWCLLGFKTSQPERQLHAPVVEAMGTCSKEGFIRFSRKAKGGQDGPYRNGVRICLSI